jgi:hypothetical protein
VSVTYLQETNFTAPPPLGAGLLVSIRQVTPAGITLMSIGMPFMHAREGTNFGATVGGFHKERCGPATESMKLISVAEIAFGSLTLIAPGVPSAIMQPAATGPGIPGFTGTALAAGLTMVPAVCASTGNVAQAATVVAAMSHILMSFVMSCFSLGD